MSCVEDEMVLHWAGVRYCGMSLVADVTDVVLSSTQSNTEERPYYIYLLRTHPARSASVSRGRTPDQTVIHPFNADLSSVV